MIARHYHWYCDARTRDLLHSSSAKVLLLGGYLGYANFGDILQLKSTCHWHRNHTGRESVILCDAEAIGDTFLICHRHDSIS